MFQCYSLRSSHPRLLPQSSKVCSIYLCLFFCPAYWVMNTIFFFFVILFIYLFISFIFISWRLITLQYCSGFCHTLTSISHGVTCIPHLDHPSHLPLTRSFWVFPVHQARALVSCIIIQSEVSQKDKEHYRILTHIYGI